MELWMLFSMLLMYFDFGWVGFSYVVLGWVSVGFGG